MDIIGGRKYRLWGYIEEIAVDFGLEEVKIAMSGKASSQEPVMQSSSSQIIWLIIWLIMHTHIIILPQ